MEYKNKTTRVSVFETNSSSSHTVAVGYGIKVTREEALAILEFLRPDEDFDADMNAWSITDGFSDSYNEPEETKLHLRCLNASDEDIDAEDFFIFDYRSTEYINECDSMKLTDVIKNIEQAPARVSPKLGLAANVAGVKPAWYIYTNSITYG